MRKLAIFLLGLFVVAGLVVSYAMYGQLRIGSMTLEASPDLQSNGQGARCGNVAFVVQARSLGRWPLRVEKGQTLSGVVAVGGADNLDVGLRIWSPTERLVVNEPERAHRHEFEVGSAIRGDYIFEFDNRHSAFTEKQVTVSICVA